jgi:arylsulfatase A-like enzyme
MRICITILVSALTLQAGAQSGAQPDARSGGRPNIIFILADDLGYGDLGSYGQQKIETPNIDAMASSGLRFTQFYAGTAVCAPSRASFMTGRHTGHTPVRGNREFKPEGQFPLPDSTVTIARLLQDKGYMTADFGKWGLGYPGSGGEPLKQGFSLFYGYNCQHLAHNYYPDHLWQNDQRVELTVNKQGDSIYAADLIHQHAMEFLRQRKDKPFFLFLSYTLPHAALSVPHDAVYAYYVKKFNEPPRSQATTPRYEKAAFEPYPHAAYAAMVARLDKYVGEVRAELERQGIAGNTLVLFSSDNGPHKEGGNEPDFFDSNGPLKGIKRDLYEGGIRVPFIACWPGKIRAGTKSAFAGAFWDLFPTFSQLAGVTASRQIDGVSIVPTLLGDAGRQQQHAYLYWEFHENGGRQAIRWGKWKGIRLNVHNAPDAPMELYDLGTDGGEKDNIAAQHPDIVGKLSAMMREAHVPDKSWPLLAGEGPMDQ